MIKSGFAVSFLLLVSRTLGARDPPGFEDGSDLESFVSVRKHSRRPWP